MDRLRVTLKISRLDANNPAIRQSIDLYHNDYVEKFTQKAAEQLETGSTIIKHALSELTDQVEEYRLSKIESRKNRKPKARELSEER